jgi:hypothetical protein
MDCNIDVNKINAILKKSLEGIDDNTLARFPFYIKFNEEDVRHGLPAAEFGPSRPSVSRRPQWVVRNAIRR